MYRLGVQQPTLLLVGVLGVAAVAACSGAPTRPKSGSPATPPPKTRAAVPDDCAIVPGKPAPDPLKREYLGVAAKAKCDRGVYTIMGGVTHFLGVECSYCHDESDYPKMTHRKRIANWMAQELIPSLQAKTGKDIWCNDCHVVDGKGTAKILKDPRNQPYAVEWMSTQLVERFTRPDGEPLRCKACHGANIGSPDFKRELILKDLGIVDPPAAPPPTAPTPPAKASDTGAPADASAPPADGGKPAP